VIVTIHQPNFLPWLGFFAKIAQADAMVLLDTVQYHKNEWQNRNRIKGPQGAIWVTVPVGYRFPMRIDEVPVANAGWGGKAVRTLEQAYAKAPFCDEVLEGLAPLLLRGDTLLAPLAVDIVAWAMERLGIQTPLHVASRMGAVSEDPTQRLIDLTRALGGTTYLSGPQGRDYLEPAAFDAAGVGLDFFNYRHPEYAQLHGDFVPYLSVVDLMMNCGPSSLEILLSGCDKEQV